jgi:hypothetical protein
MKTNVAKEVAALGRMTVKALQARYAEVFGEETRAHHKQWLIKRIAWRLQALAEGDLSERARHRAAELANDADLRLSPPKVPNAASPSDGKKTVAIQSDVNGRLPIPGTIISRLYKGRTLLVRTLGQGFEFEGEVYTSLSAVAKAITGQHCSGHYFFRLKREATR